VLFQQPGNATKVKGVSQVDGLRVPGASWPRPLSGLWPAPGEPAIQRVRAENPVPYCKGRLSLVPKHVRVAGELRQVLLYTESVAATVAFLKDIAVNVMTFG